MCDFGFARISHELSRTNSAGPGRYGGFERHLAPEIYLGESKRFTAQSDAYALAMTITSLASNDHVFPHYEIAGRAAYMAAEHGERPTRPLMPAGDLMVKEMDSVWALLETMWNKDQSVRPRLSEVYNVLADILFPP